MSDVFVLTSVVYSSVKTVIHVRPVEQIVLWSESQPSVYYARLRYVRHSTKIRVSVDEKDTRLHLAAGRFSGSGLLWVQLYALLEQ